MSCNIVLKRIQNDYKLGIFRIQNARMLGRDVDVVKCLLDSVTMYLVEPRTELSGESSKYQAELAFD